MIDGEKIFKALKLGKVTGLGCTLTSAECDYLIAHDDVLTQYITLLEKEQRWISVSERLPENKFEKVLVCTTYGVSVRLALEIGEAVTHWMPLPQPPATYYLRVGGGYWKDDRGQELVDGVVSLWKGLEE